MSAIPGLSPVLPLGQVAVASLTTTWRGAVRVTVVVKATFAFAPNAEVTPAPPVEVTPRDVHRDGNPMRSLQRSADLCPHLERAEVTFVGHAHAPGGTPVQALTARLALAGDRGIVLDKRLSVVGDRDEPRSDPVPFTKMRLGYERTAGGLEHPGNPIGVGFTGGLPNVVHADPARSAEPAGFGPLPAMWKVRSLLLRGLDRLAFERGPVTLPDDLDWSYFQSAPTDQRIVELPERAWMLLEGLHPSHPSLRMRLPHLVATARVYAASGAQTDLALRADTLQIDGEAERCSVTWRGSFPVAGLAAIPDHVVVAGVHPPGQPLAWPTASELSILLALAAPAAAPGPSVIFRAPAELKQTVEAPPSVGGRALPFSMGSAPPAPAPPPAASPHVSEVAQMTADLFASDLGRLPVTALPFAGAMAPSPPRVDAPAVPGAPWSAVPAPRSRPVAAVGALTMILGGEDPPPAPPPPAAAPRPPEIVPPPSAPAPVAVHPEPPPPAPPPVPAPVVHSAAPAVEKAERPPAPEPRRRTPEAPAPPVQPPPPPPVASIPRVPVPAAASRKAYGKFGPDR